MPRGSRGHDEAMPADIRPNATRVRRRAVGGPHRRAPCATRRCGPQPTMRTPASRAMRCTDGLPARCADSKRRTPMETVAADPRLRTHTRRTSHRSPSACKARTRAEPTQGCGRGYRMRRRTAARRAPGASAVR
ncbi:hypothetical protein ADU20_11890 [Burkholderia pseudomallei]|nr:hypothetical protein ADU20_11890 [Burkholderia pseudomallei]